MQNFKIILANHVQLQHSTICSNIANPIKLAFYYKKLNQHKVTTNWKNYVPWHVPQKSVSFSRPDFKIFPFQFPWFQSCASTSAPLVTDNQPGESLESKITFSLVHVGMVNLRFSIFLAWFTIFIVKLDRQLFRKVNRLGFSFRKQNSVESQRQIRMHTIDVAYQSDVCD